MTQYLPVLLMCLWLSLAPAVGVSVPRHRKRFGRLLAATLTSAAMGTVAGFAAALAAVSWWRKPGGNAAQQGVGYLLVMLAVSLLTSYIVAKSFPAATEKSEDEHE